MSNLYALRECKYGLCDWDADMASEVGEQDLALLKQFYESRRLPGVFNEMTFKEQKGKRVGADVIVSITEGPPLAKGIIEAAGHGTSMYNLGSILTKGPTIGPNAASNKRSKKLMRGFYCFRMPELCKKPWHYVTFVSPFGNGTLVGAVLLLRVDLTLQHQGYSASTDQWSMHNLKGVHITGVHFRLFKQSILSSKTNAYCVEVGWDPSLEFPFEVV